MKLKRVHRLRCQNACRSADGASTTASQMMDTCSEGLYKVRHDESREDQLDLQVRLHRRPTHDAARVHVEHH